MGGVETLIGVGANVLLYVVAAGALWSWVRAPRSVKLRYAASFVLAALFVAVLVKVGGVVWDDPRPFVVDQVTPLIAHGPDNGFPSDHTALASGTATVVLLRDRVVGVVVAILAVLLGVCRVLALVHHVPDVLASVLIGAASGVGAVLLVQARRRPAG